MTVYHDQPGRQKGVTTNVRRLLYSLATVLFLLSTPVIVMYAQGYRLQLHKFRLYKTISLAVQSVPSGADILIDGKLRQRTPTTISGLFPGSYTIRLTRGGFTPWEAHVDLSSVSATLTPHLFPHALRSLVLQSQNELTVAGSENGQLALLRKSSDQAVDLGILTARTGMFEYVANLTGHRSSFSSPTLHWSPSGKKIAACFHGRCLVVDANTSPATVVQSFQVPEDSKVIWSGSGTDLLVLTGGTLWLASLSPGEAPRVVVSPHITDVVVVGGKIGVIEAGQKNSVRFFDIHGSPLGQQTFQLSGRIASFIGTTNKDIFIRDGLGTLALDTLSEKIIQIDALGVRMVATYHDENTALLASDSEVWTTDLKTGSTRLLARFSQVVGAGSLAQSGNIIVLLPQELRALEPSYPSAHAGSLSVGEQPIDLIDIGPNVLGIQTLNALTVLDFNR